MKSRSAGPFEDMGKYGEGQARVGGGGMELTLWRLACAAREQLCDDEG